MSLITRIACLVLVGLLLGCQQGGTPVPENTIPPTELIRNDLQSIIDSNQLGSEMVTIEENINKIAETNPQKAEALRKEYNVLNQRSGSPAAHAKKMMAKL